MTIEGKNLIIVGYYHWEQDHSSSFETVLRGMKMATRAEFVTIKTKEDGSIEAMFFQEDLTSKKKSV